MLEGTKTRQLISLECLGTVIQGTFHRPTDRFVTPPSTARVRVIGILFLNSLSLPRAATGDSAVHWADSFAERGYPSFRFDLPGVGDSDGNISTDFLEFINAGGYASIAAACVKALAARMALSGVIIVGHCAGSVSALYAAAAARECTGLVLMDPYFYLTQMIRPVVRTKLSEWARSNRIGEALSDIYDRLRESLLYVRRERLPGNANVRLLNCWKQVATAGTPILMLKAPGLKAAGMKLRVGQFDYLQHVTKLAGNKSRVTIKLIEGTDHSFANRTGPAAVGQQIQSWLEKYFPIASSEEGARGAYSVMTPRDDEKECVKPKRVSSRVGCTAGGG